VSRKKIFFKKKLVGDKYQGEFLSSDCKLE